MQSEALCASTELLQWNSQAQAQRNGPIPAKGHLMKHLFYVLQKF